MWNFQYKHGDRPLEGYTIERAAGRGGFGEVYFAVSDTGRQVALKVVQGYEQIELRGISQCMNLKNPHLVSIFDVRYNDQGRPFVIMEFVAGPSLRQLIDESPSGLGTQKAAFFLREIGKGLSFLHDNGIVHRDLKPANIFYENGYVKIGDYGLSKLINPTQHSGQTVTVGTVHYMAPEIGAGKYDRSIDLYALGAVLYEMLTGMVPYNGASPSEVLLKHLTSEPDVKGIAEPFASVIRKAMCKDPAQRYQSVQEMVEAVFGAEHVRQSVSVFSPDELSVVAGHAAQRAAAGVGAGVGAGVAAGGSGPQNSDAWQRVGTWADRLTDRLGGVGDRVVDLGARMAGAAPATTAPSSHTMAVEPPEEDPLNRRQRRFLAIITAIAAGVVTGLIVSSGAHGLEVVPFVSLTAIGAAVGINKAARRFAPQAGPQPGHEDSQAAQRIAAGAMATLFAVPFSAVTWGGFHFGRSMSFPATLLAIYIPMFLMNTPGWASVNRKERVSFWDFAFMAGLFGAILAGILGGESKLAGLTLMSIAITTQVCAPWNPRAHQQKKEEKRKKKWQDFKGQFYRYPAVEMPSPQGSAASPMSGDAASTTAMSADPVNAEADSDPGRRKPFVPVRGFIRVAWLVATLFSFAIGLALVIAAGVTDRPLDFAPMLCAGLGGLAASVVFLVQACRRRFVGMWSNAVKPLLIVVCIVPILIAAAFLARPGYRIQPAEYVFAIFAIVFPAAGIITVLAIRGPRRIAEGPSPTNPATEPATPPPSPRDRLQEWGERRKRLRLVRLRLFSPVALLAWPILLAATVLMLAAALNLPEAVSAGLPDPSLAQELNTRTFSDYPAWPELLQRLALLAAIIFSALGIVALAMSRRSAGVGHLLRGVIGAVVLVASAALVGKDFHPSAWTHVAELVNAHRPTAAVAAFTDAFVWGHLVFCGVMFLFSQILLSWPPRQDEPAMTREKEASS